MSLSIAFATHSAPRMCQPPGRARPMATAVLADRRPALGHADSGGRHRPPGAHRISLPIAAHRAAGAAAPLTSSPQTARYSADPHTVGSRRRFRIGRTMQAAMYLSQPPKARQHVHQLARLTGRAGPCFAHFRGQRHRPGQRPVAQAVWRWIPHQGCPWIPAPAMPRAAGAGFCPPVPPCTRAPSLPARIPPRPRRRDDSAPRRRDRSAALLADGSARPYRRAAVSWGQLPAWPAVGARSPGRPGPPGWPGRRR